MRVPVLLRIEVIRLAGGDYVCYSKFTVVSVDQLLHHFLAGGERIQKILR